MKTLLSLLAFSCCVFAFGQSKDLGPNCGGPDHWTALATFTRMKNEGLVDNQNFDLSKTTTVRLASQKIGRDLWHQVYQVTFTRKSGEIVEAIAIHDASTEECSMSGVEVFVVSKHLSDVLFRFGQTK